MKENLNVFKLFILTIAFRTLRQIDITNFQRYWIRAGHVPFFLAVSLTVSYKR